MDWKKLRNMQIIAKEIKNMANGIVIYKSKYGATKKYAELQFHAAFLYSSINFSFISLMYNNFS